MKQASLHHSQLPSTIQSLQESGKSSLQSTMAPFGKSFEKTRDRLGERLRQLTVYLSDPLEEKEREYIVKELLRAAKKNGEKIQDLGQKRQKKDTADQSCFQLRCEGIKTLLRQESE